MNVLRIPCLMRMQIFDFVDDVKEEVRSIAVEGIAGLSLDSGFQEMLSVRPDLLVKLFDHVFDASLPVAHEAWRALVNLAQNRSIARLLGDKFCIVVADYVCCCAGIGRDATLERLTVFAVEQLVFSDLACMLLSNMSKNAGCSEQLVPFTAAFMDIVLERTTQAKGTFGFLISVLADMTVVAECRRFLSEGEHPKFLRLLSLIGDASVVTRGGVCAVVKNCLMETDRHQTLLEDHDDTLLTALLGRLVGPECEFSEPELDRMFVEVALEHRFAPVESDAAIREMIIESLLALGTTADGRQLLRDKECYPVLREWHKREPEEALQALMEKVVEYIIRDEDDCGSRPTKTRRISKELETECGVEECVVDSLI